MKRRNALVTGLLAISCLISSCKKDDQYRPYDVHIKGVNFTDVQASPTGSMGTPDVNTISGTFLMTLYPNPGVDHMYLGVKVDSPEPVTLTVKLVHAIYAGAPQGTVIENESLAGAVAVTETRAVDATDPGSAPSGGLNNAGGPTKGKYVLIELGIDNLPRGFYRMYAELSNGERYWDNAWITR